MKTIYKFGAATLLFTSLLAGTAFAGSLEEPIFETVPAPVFDLLLWVGIGPVLMVV